MKKHPHEYLETGLTGFRIAGNGMNADNYDDESFPDYRPHATRIQVGRTPARLLPKAKEPAIGGTRKHSEVKIIRPAKAGGRK